MKVVVTGAAGFIGSHLSERCIADGHEVVGIDCLTDYYSESEKRRNLDPSLESKNFEFHRTNLATDSLDAVLEGADVVFHQAGQPGVRASWGSGFDPYLSDNIHATQRLLEHFRERPLLKFVYASSSSVYGNAEGWPTAETALPKPRSPYGVSKLAAEHLCGLYAANFGVPTISLRYFTVFGPRQRPDMAMHRLFKSVLQGTSFHLYGDGSKVRDFTYVSDVVSANLRAAMVDVTPGAVMNIAGGAGCSMAELIEIVADLAGGRPVIDQAPDADGDVERTGGDTSLAQTLLGWQPRIDLRTGLSRQLDWVANT